MFDEIKWLEKNYFYKWNLLLNERFNENGHTIGESECIGSFRISEIYHAIKWNSRCKLSLYWWHFALLSTLLGSQLPASESRHIQHRSTCVSSFLKQRGPRWLLTVVSWHEIRASLSRKIIIDEIRSALHMSLNNDINRRVCGIFRKFIPKNKIKLYRIKYNGEFIIHLDVQIFILNLSKKIAIKKIKLNAYKLINSC